MPAVQPPATVLVTGVSGFSGIWIARALLEDGFAVRGTVRSENKDAYVADLFKDHGGRFKPVIVPDISKSDAYDSVIDDSIEAVVHVAGVADFSRTVSSAKNVKRFVYMSSAQAMLGNEDPFHVYTENDWADNDLALVKEKGGAAGGTALYRASKVLSERAVVDFVEEHKEIGWDATRILPVWISGPLIHDWKTLEDLNLSSKLLYEQLTTSRDGDKVNEYASDFVDVRDVAEAFVAALKVEGAANERFIIDAGAFTFQNLYDAVHATAPDLEGVVYGNPDAPPFPFPGPFADSSKAKRVLQLKEFRGLGECAVDTIRSIQAKLQAV
ncbi:NAD-P-binding protein [Daedaleopsis nitida]|nr:NAD-P-binding protein [Daedaleopsis nitida]